MMMLLLDICSNAVRRGLRCDTMDKRRKRVIIYQSVVGIERTLPIEEQIVQVLYEHI